MGPSSRSPSRMISRGVDHGRPMGPVLTAALAHGLAAGGSGGASGVAVSDSERGQGAGSARGRHDVGQPDPVFLGFIEPASITDCYCVSFNDPAAVGSWHEACFLRGSDAPPRLRIACATRA